jgi:GNAT superfamily N-acetyltransferase
VTLNFRLGTAADASDLAALVASAYRGDDSRAGWTTEADYVTAERIDAAGVREVIAAPDHEMLVATGPDGTVLACCEVADLGDGVAYFGLFAVRPVQQGGGVGRQVLAEAERYVRDRWAATTMEMTVIGQRSELIEWYARRGYGPSGRTRPFPYDQIPAGGALRDDLYFTILTKQLA